VSVLTLAQATQLVVSVRGELRRGYVCVTTVHGICEARADASFRRILNHSWLTTPDGMPLVWLGPRGVTRVYGPDLLHAVCDEGRIVGLRHFFYGGNPGVVQELQHRLTGQFPGLQVVGTYTPPFRPLTAEEWSEFSGLVRDTRPDVIWVGISTPKQERFMAEAWPKLEAGVLIGVGAAFDFFSGRVRQAPRWMQRSGLEWLFRLCMEPRRLAGRYLRTNPRFIAGVILQKLRIRKYPLN
jgi:N-acetylglucosaminyldiphosphoundecaprenol N-acetyl-beta-D-mannosaminyltransferase